MASVLESSVSHLIHRVSQAATDSFARQVGDADMTPRQLAVLTVVGSVEGASQTDIVTVTGIDRSTLADIARRLVKKGLLKRRRSKTDQRRYELALSDAGEIALKTLAPAMARAEAEILKGLPTQRRADLMAMLQSIAAKDVATR